MLMLWIGVIVLTGHFVEAFELGKSRQANMELNFENPIMEKYLYSKFGGEQKSKAVSKVGKLPAGQNEVDGFIVASYYNDAGENDIYSYFPSSSLPISMF